MHFSQSVVLWHGMGGIQKMALFGKRPSPYYGKYNSNKQIEKTVHHYFKTWRSFNPENVTKFESFFKCSRKNHQALWWNWSDESKFEIFGSNLHAFVRCRVGERMISACVVPTVKHGGGGVIVWGCFAGDTVSDLFRIHGTLHQHGNHSILKQYAIPSGLHLVGLSFVFQQDNDPKHTWWGLFDQGEW